MLQRITKIPSRFYQLVLLNIGLILALSKQMSLLAIFSSLVFVALIVAPVAIALGILSPPPHQLIHEQISSKIRQYQGSLKGYLSKWEQLSTEKKTNTIIKVLIGLYVSMNFMCPCVETFLLVNFCFAYFFMQQQVEQLQQMMCKMCRGECPIGHRA